MSRLPIRSLIAATSLLAVSSATADAATVTAGPGGTLTHVAAPGEAKRLVGER